MPRSWNSCPGTDILKMEIWSRIFGLSLWNLSILLALSTSAENSGPARCIFPPPLYQMPAAKYHDTHDDHDTFTTLMILTILTILGISGYSHCLTLTSFHPAPIIVDDGAANEWIVTRLTIGRKSEKKSRGRIFLASLSASEPRDPVCGLLGRVSGSRGVTESLFLLSSTELYSAPLSTVSLSSFYCSSVFDWAPLSLPRHQGDWAAHYPFSHSHPHLLCAVCHSHILTHLCRVPFSPTACQGRSPRQKKAAPETGTPIWKSLCSQWALAIYFVHSNLKCTWNMRSNQKMKQSTLKLFEEYLVALLFDMTKNQCSGTAIILVGFIYTGSVIGQWVLPTECATQLLASLCSSHHCPFVAHVDVLLEA